MIVVVKPKNNEIVVGTTATTIGQMNDVDFSGLSENDVLKYSSGKWINTPLGADLNYTHSQSSASSVWTITHNLNKFPNYTVIDSSGDEVEGDVTYINNQQLILTFSAAFSGTAYLN